MMAPRGKTAFARRVRLAASAMESISRQPEAAGDIRGGMILAAALIEGVTLLAIITCLLAIFMKGYPG